MARVQWGTCTPKPKQLDKIYFWFLIYKNLKCKSLFDQKCWTAPPNQISSHATVITQVLATQKVPATQKWVAHEPLVEKYCHKIPIYFLRWIINEKGEVCTKKSVWTFLQLQFRVRTVTVCVYVCVCFSMFGNILTFSSFDLNSPSAHQLFRP
jgi:hypothetical protein